MYVRRFRGQTGDFHSKETVGHGFSVVHSNYQQAFNRDYFSRGPRSIKFINSGSETQLRGWKKDTPLGGLSVVGKLPKGNIIGAAHMSG